MEGKSSFREMLGSPYAIPALFAALKLALHLSANTFPPFELFRDELYYIVSTDHLDAGYVDHPPLSIWILAVGRLLFGDSLFAVRLLPAISGAVIVFLAGVMVRELGGSRSAQAIACGATLVSLAAVAFHAIYSMNAWDWLVWSLAVLLLLRLAKGPSLRLWTILGVILGLGLLNKLSVLWLGAGIGAGILFSPLRSELRTKGPWIAAGIAFAFFIPYVLWNAANEWAHLEFMRNAASRKYSGINPMDTLLGQVLINNPATLPLWLVGLAFFFLPSNRVWRPAGLVYVTTLVILLANGTSKPEYLAPAVPVLFAGGAVFVDRIRAKRLRIGTQWGLAVLFAFGALLIPLVLPVLSAEQYIRFSGTLGVKTKNMESNAESDLPQFYADMHGWKDLAASVETVYRSLSEEERSACVIYAQNYGQASAITHYGRPFGLPAAVSGHNSYFLWGPGTVTDPRVVIIVGGRQADHERGFADVTVAKIHSSPHIMPYEDQKPIYVCRQPKSSLGDLWKSVKHYM